MRFEIKDCWGFQSTLPARGATRSRDTAWIQIKISIHAPRTGSDGRCLSRWRRAVLFQSTLPARGATRSTRDGTMRVSISIHAPRTGSDAGWTMTTTSTRNFNPRSPHGERRQQDAIPSVTGGISIHAPRTGSDTPSAAGFSGWGYFNPRSPHGERRYHLLNLHSVFQFQSTLPARGATADVQERGDGESISIHAPRTGSDKVIPNTKGIKIISIHAPRTGSDVEADKTTITVGDFNPRSPHGERHETINRNRELQDFNPRSPHGERLYSTSENDCLRFHFNPRSPHGERPRDGRNFAVAFDFNPRSPHGERQRKVTILSIRIIGFAQKVYHKTVLLRISLAENAVILPKRPQNPVRTSLQKAGGLRFARAIRAARPYSISSPSGA